MRAYQRRCLVFATAWWAAAGTCTTSSSLTSLAPAEVHGYRLAGPPTVYTHETLFDLLDGGAEVYRSFNVRQVASQRYSKANAPEILADVFDMGSSRDAYGAYHHDTRQGHDVGIGNESEAEGSSLWFWKGRYFVSVIALARTPDVGATVAAVGRAIASAIDKPGRKPEISEGLPRQGLMSSHLIYFHDLSYLSTRYRFVGAEQLGLNLETEGILARYHTCAKGAGTEVEPLSSSCVVVIVRYPMAGESVRAAASLLAAQIGGTQADGVGQRKDGQWVAVEGRGHTLIAVLDAPHRNAAETMRNALRKAHWP